MRNGDDNECNPTSNNKHRARDIGRYLLGRSHRDDLGHRHSARQRIPVCTVLLRATTRSVEALFKPRKKGIKAMTNRTEFLNYSIGPATSVEGGRHGHYVVTAEYVSGYQVISFHESKRDAQAAIKRYQAADVRRSQTKDPHK
jgi:hypothetical protein